MEDVSKQLEYRSPYAKGVPNSRAMTETEAMSQNMPCSSPLGLYAFYKTFKIFGIVIHFPAFWRKRKIKGKFFNDEELLKD